MQENIFTTDVIWYTVGGETFNNLLLHIIFTYKRCLLGSDSLFIQSWRWIYLLHFWGLIFLDFHYESAVCVRQHNVPMLMEMASELWN